MSKTALVTGATGCIGTAICQKLQQDGLQVVAHYRSEENLAKWVPEMATQGFEFATALCDIKDYEEVEQMADGLIEEYGGIDILVNNAGIVADGAFHKLKPENWRDVIETNLLGTMNVTHCVYSEMRNKGFGRIINIGSVNGRRGQFGQTNYCAAKAGIHGFTKSLAMECASKGITVNTVAPGYVNTPMVANIPTEYLNEKLLPNIPIGRLAEPAEIADLVSFLASSKGAYITGAELSINGGQHVY